MKIVVAQAIIKKQCKRLYLQNNNITASGTSIITAALNNNTILEILNISNNHIFDMGVKSISKINNSVLQVLDLGSNEITDFGIQYLIEMLKINQTLLFLGLAFNKISDQGVQLLVNTLSRHNNRLKELYLNRNRLVTDSSIDALVEMIKSNRSLTTFSIGHCNLSKNGQKKLRRTTRWKFFFSIQT